MQTDLIRSEVVLVSESCLTQSIGNIVLDFKFFTPLRVNRIQKHEEVALSIINTASLTIINNKFHGNGMCELVICRVKSNDQELPIGLICPSLTCEVNEILLDGLNT